MTTFLAAFAVIGGFLLAGSVGVLMGRAPIAGSCGGLGALGLKKDCGACGGDPGQCPRKRRADPPG
jgi:hypothetical protein